MNENLQPHEAVLSVQQAATRIQIELIKTQQAAERTLRPINERLTLTGRKW